jgi:hypothetical protein
MATNLALDDNSSRKRAAWAKRQRGRIIDVVLRGLQHRALTCCAVALNRDGEILTTDSDFAHYRAVLKVRLLAIMKTCSQ